MYYETGALVGGAGLQFGSFCKPTCNLAILTRSSLQPIFQVDEVVVGS
jgi:hypothetical protein